MNAPFIINKLYHPCFHFFSAVVFFSNAARMPHLASLFSKYSLYIVPNRFKYRQSVPFTVPVFFSLQFKIVSNTVRIHHLLFLFQISRRLSSSSCSPPPPPSFGTNMYSFSYCSFKYCVKYCQKASFSRPCSQTRAVPNRSK